MSTSTRCPLLLYHLSKHGLHVDALRCLDVDVEEADPVAFVLDVRESIEGDLLSSRLDGVRDLVVREHWRS